MCKFDKNQSYSTRTVFEALINKFPDEREESLFPLIGQRFTALKCVPVNKQKKNRFFSGKDCQVVFDYYDEKFCKKYGLPYRKAGDKQITIEQAIRPKKKNYGVQVTINSEAVIADLDRRCKYYGSSRGNFVTEILRAYFIEHPFDEIEVETANLETREDWVNYIKEKFGDGNK